MKNIVLALVLIPVVVFSQQKENIAQVISLLMAEQEKSWNNYDIDGFMKHYWQHDSLKFIGGKGVTYGWENTLENYKKTYANNEKMGVLNFKNHLIEVVDENNAIVCGNWKIKRKDEEIGGNYTLLWKKINGKWVIVLDHTG